jgi:hypothetical protein
MGRSGNDGWRLQALAVFIRARRAETARGGFERFGERSPRCDGLALCARPRAEAARPGPRFEIGVALRSRRASDKPLDAHLPVQVIPVHHGRGARIRFELPAFARAVIRVENDVTRLGHDRLAEDDARRRRRVGRDGREHHRIGIGLGTQADGVVEPANDDAERVGRKVRREQFGRHGHCAADGTEGRS